METVFPDTTENKWYHNQWKVALLLIAVYPVGLYGLIKSKAYKGVLLKFFAVIVGIIIVVAGFNLSDKNSRYSFTGKVHNSQWDGSVDVAERYLKKNLLKDPDSYESIGWGKVTQNSDGTYSVNHTHLGQKIALVDMEFKP